MMTIRQVEKLWKAGKFVLLAKELLAARSERSANLETVLSGRVATAAMALIRADELSQSNHPFCQQLIHSLIAHQQADGGWGEPVVTAIVLRALRTSGGNGMVLDRGFTALAQLQKAEGAWPTGPLRRMPEDPFASAFILFSLGGDECFRAAVQFDRAIEWFITNGARLDGETRRLWDRAAIRCQIRVTSTDSDSPDRNRVAA